MGSIVKSGSAPISGVLSPGDKLTQKGLIYAATPASDFICGTLQLAAGMNLHIFTTGRGTPYGLAEVPVIKGRHAQRSGAPLARPDGHQRRPHRQRRSHDCGSGLGAVPADARRGQRPRDLGRKMETA
jgi:galactarate dehydratase